MTSASNPFEGMPFFGDLMKMLGSQGPVQWDGARQLAISIATDGGNEANVDPLDRITYQQLSRVAEMQVAAATGLEVSSTGAISINPVTRSQWVLMTLDAYRPLVEKLAAALKPQNPAGPTPGTMPAVANLDPDAGDAWLGQLMAMLSPMLLGMTTGSLVGHLSTRTFGLYDLPIPRPPADEIVVVAPNVAAFAEDWSMDGNDLRLWVCIHQLTHHVVLRVPHVRARLEELLGNYVSAFESDPDALGDSLAELEIDASGGDPMAQFQELMGNPEFVLGAVRSSRQDAILPELETLVAVIAGYVDHIMDRLGSNLIGSYQQVTEAVRRRRVEASTSDRFVERLFGLALTQDHFDRGRAFVEGVVSRAGEEGLARLWAAPQDLPTPNEVGAPGLWLARIGVDTFDSDAQIDLSGLDELLGNHPEDDAN